MNLRATALITRLAWRNVRRGWRHSLAALGTMAAGFVALAVFQGYLDDMVGSLLDVAYKRNMLGDVFVRRPGAGSPEALTATDRYLLDEREQAFLEGWITRHESRIEVRVRSLLVQGLISTGGASVGFFAMGHDVPEGRRMRRDWAWNAWAGRPIGDDEPSAILVGPPLGRLLGCEAPSDAAVFDPHTAAPIPVERPLRCRQIAAQLTATSARGQMNALDAEIVGLTSMGRRDADQSYVVMPLPMAQQLAQTKGISQYMISLRDPREAPALRAELKAEAEAAGVKLEVLDWQKSEQAELLRRGLELMATFRSLVLAVLLAVAGSAVLMTMTRTVRERTREIGTLRSLGYARGHMLAVFVLEAVLLALAAGCVGLVLAVAISAGINHAGLTYKAGLLADAMVFRIGWSVGTYVSGFAFLAGVAVIAAWLAARRVVGRRIAECLTE